MRALGKILAYLRPGYMMPLGSAIRRKLLNEYYERMHQEVAQVSKGFLFTFRGTIMFDGGEDVIGAPVLIDLI